VINVLPEIEWIFQILIYRCVYYVHFLSPATENEPKERRLREEEAPKFGSGRNIKAK
jgi:hypothetical protein